MLAMQWQQLHICCDAQQAQQLQTQLTEQGALAITLQDAADQAIFEPTPGTSLHWQSNQLTALFDENHSLSMIEQQLQQQHLSYHIEILADQAWTRKWMDDFQPMQFGEHTWIVPSWHAAPDIDAVNILLDPGLAFGTGTHPTTALCLEWLDQNNINGKTFIDYGCGSGILAIAAKKHGATSVIAVDHDPQALLATRDNAQRNSLEDDTLRVVSPEHLTDIKADIIIANILAQPLIALRSNLQALMKDTGKLVLSGILSSQHQQLLDAYQNHFHLIDCQQRDDWLRMEWQKPR